MVQLRVPRGCSKTVTNWVVVKRVLNRSEIDQTMSTTLLIKNHWQFLFIRHQNLHVEEILPFSCKLLDKLFIVCKNSQQAADCRPYRYYRNVYSQSSPNITCMTKDTCQEIIRVATAKRLVKNTCHMCIGMWYIFWWGLMQEVFTKWSGIRTWGGANKKNCYHLQLSVVATVQVVLTCPYASKIHPYSQIYTY